MPDISLNAAAKRRVVEQLTNLVKEFHEAENRNEGGFESVSRRGELGGYRWALVEILGERPTSDILDAVREETGLNFPHCGPVTTRTAAHAATIDGDDSIGDKEIAMSDECPRPSAFVESEAGRGMHADKRETRSVSGFTLRAAPRHNRKVRRKSSRKSSRG